MICQSLANMQTGSCYCFPHRATVDGKNGHSAQTLWPLSFENHKLAELVKTVESGFVKPIIAKSIGPYNYMLFSDGAWGQFNPPSHYQNRGRHSQYINLFERAGFAVLKAEPLIEYPGCEVPPDDELAPRFQGLGATDRRATGGLFCAQKQL